MTMSNLQLRVLHLQYEHKECAIPFYAQHWNGEKLQTAHMQMLYSELKHSDHSFVVACVCLQAYFLACNIEITLSDVTLQNTR
jgi:hypothetical protein